MKISSWPLIAVVALNLCSGFSASGDDLKHLLIPLEDSNAEASKGTKALVEVLSGIEPHTAPTVTIKQNGCYILSGHLFGNGNAYALATLSGQQPGEGEDPAVNTGFAVWKDGKWEARQLWRIAPVWALPDPEKKDEDYHPIRPAYAPFWLEELSGDRTPEVVIVGATWRYFQEHLLAKLSADDRLSLVADAMDRPRFTRGLLQLYSDSGRRAIFSTWRYYRWRGSELIDVAAYHSETPYDDPEAPFTRIVRHESNGQFGGMLRVTMEGENEYGLFIEGEETEISGEPEGEAAKRPPHAVVTFQWPPGKAPEAHSQQRIEEELGYLWTVFTGLSPSLKPSETSSGTKPPSRLPNGVKVRVRGNPELIRKFSNNLFDRLRSRAPAKPRSR